MAKLLSRHLLVMRMTQIPRVAVDVEAAKRQRRFMIDGSRQLGTSGLKAQLAEPVGSHQPAQSQALPHPPTLPLDGDKGGQVKLALTAHIAACS